MARSFFPDRAVALTSSSGASRTFPAPSPLASRISLTVPPGVMHGFRNAGDEYAHLLVVLGGADSGKVFWAKSVIEQAATTGLKLDSDGNIVDVAAAE